MSRKRNCDFALAIVKGLVEHDDGHAYFGSLLGYRAHEQDGIQRGLLIRGPKVCRDGDQEFILEATRLTDAGRKAYDELHLERLPNKAYGRAYFWDWDVLDD